VEHALWEWAAFGGIVLVMLALDLGVFHREDHVIGPREALAWSGVWIALALAFGGWVTFRHCPTAGLEYVTGYVIEKSLSVDNIFVFVVLFGALAIPPLYQHRVLYWGILSALVLRGAMIAGGAALLHRFQWLMYVFGAFLLVTGARLFFARGAAPHPEQSGAFRLLRRVVPGTARLDGHAFFTREDGRLVATPLFFALALIELSDVIFAVDSIPAIFAVTTDPYIVFTSNIFAILGLRSLYFLLAGLVERFTYLKPSLAAVLVFVGAKMAAADLVHLHPAASLAAIVAILAIGVVASLAKARRERQAKGQPDEAAP
jgi:tellurite resistance protein TerC